MHFWLHLIAQAWLLLQSNKNAIQSSFWLDWWRHTRAINLVLDVIAKCNPIQDHIQSSFFRPLVIILKQMVKIADLRYSSTSSKYVKKKTIKVNYNPNLFHRQMFLLIFNTAVHWKLKKNNCFIFGGSKSNNKWRKWNKWRGNISWGNKINWPLGEVRVWWVFAIRCLDLG